MKTNRKKPFIARQGDVLIERIEAMPAKRTAIPRENGRVILAHGEVTGHAHAIVDEKCDLYASPDAPMGVTYLEIQQAVVALKHDEHSTIELPEGKYRVTRQREYAPSEIRNVAD
jgi:hypothetical protein